MSALTHPSVGHRRTLIGTVVFALIMLGLAYAAVPLYRRFCAATGFAGTTQRAATIAGIHPVAGRTMKIRFDANISPGMPWQFAPAQPGVTVQIGAQNMAYFHAASLSAAATTGSARYNVTPDVAGKYFTKIQCFCFNEQTLRAGQSVDMPVVFYVDPAILNDPIARKVDEITLSYTFYPVDKPASPVRAYGAPV